jgi:hypothetical protein
MTVFMDSIHTASMSPSSTTHLRAHTQTTVNELDNIHAV